jgi:microcystin-dependent protein
MSELRVDTLKPALNPSKITITPGVVVTDNTDMEQFEVTSSGEIKVLGPLRVGSSVSNTPGSSSQVLTSQGTGLPPVWTEGFPIGGIIIWYGSATAIPRGWALCNGDEVNGYRTPNLTNRFIVGAGGSYTINQNGGNADAVVVAHTHTVTDPGHSHRLPTDSTPGPDSQSLTPTANADEGYGVRSESSKTGITIASAGESGTGKNLPPYYALCYIMRVPTS